MLFWGFRKRVVSWIFDLQQCFVWVDVSCRIRELRFLCDMKERGAWGERVGGLTWLYWFGIRLLSAALSLFSCLLYKYKYKPLSFPILSMFPKSFDSRKRWFQGEKIRLFRSINFISFTLAYIKNEIWQIYFIRCLLYCTDTGTSYSHRTMCDFRLGVSRTEVLESFEVVFEIHRMLRRTMKRRGRVMCDMEARCGARGEWGMWMYICESCSWSDGGYWVLSVFHLLRAVDIN